MLNNTRIAGALALAFGLAACGGAMQNTGLMIAQDTATVAQVTLSPADVAALWQTCQAAQPALAVATQPGVPAAVSGTAVYPAAFCQQLLAGMMPPTADSSSPAWLGKVLAATQDVATIANVVLPIALKALPLVMAVL